MIKLKSLLKELLEDYPVGWNLETFKSLNSFAKRVAYCNQTLKRLASGSSRIAYQVDEEKVLKLAKNNKGIAQNSVENDWFVQQSYSDIVAKVFEVDENNLWLEMELARKVSPTRFKNLLGFTPDNLLNYLTYHNYQNNGKQEKSQFYLTRIPQNELEYLQQEDGFGNRMVSFIMDLSLSGGDFGRLSSFGEVSRDGKPTIVVIDFGLSKQVAQDFYGANFL